MNGAGGFATRILYRKSASSADQQNRPQISQRDAESPGR